MGMLNLANRFLFPVRAEHRDLLRRIAEARRTRPVRVMMASKPLQYINMRCAPDFDKYFNVLLLVKNFCDADRLFARIEAVDGEVWGAAAKAAVWQDAFAVLLAIPNVAECWTFVDYGVKVNFALKALHARGTRICLYEEGIGNYAVNPVMTRISHPFLSSRPWLKKIVFDPVQHFFHRISGAGDWLNCGQWTDLVYLYRPEYPGIPRGGARLASLGTTPMVQFANMAKLFAESEGEAPLPEGKRILICATAWDGEYAVSEDDRRAYDLICIKLHPHITKMPEPKEGAEQLRFYLGNLPVEILVIDLLSRQNQVTLRSKFSSSMIYLLSLPIRIEYDRREIPPEFEAFIRYLAESDREKNSSHAEASVIGR